jgi:peptide/nickel transport system permease protein
MRAPTAKVTASGTAVLPRLRRRMMRRGRKIPIVACMVCLAFLIAAIFGELIAPYGIADPDFAATLTPPFWMQDGSAAHILGTDQLGRDILSRLIGGARISLITATSAIVFAGAIGIFLGLVAGFFGGLLEAIIMRVVDAFLALPFILMALALVAALGSGLENIVLVMILTNWARYARLVHSETLSIKERDFVTLARIAGVSPMRIALRHVLPNAINSVSVLAILDFGRAIILESSLSFLGLGIQPPDVSWGSMLADGKSEMQFAWWLTVWPGLAILIAVLSFNALGEWLKGELDPRSML